MYNIKYYNYIFNIENREGDNYWEYFRRDGDWNMS